MHSSYLALKLIRRINWSSRSQCMEIIHAVVTGITSASGPNSKSWFTLPCHFKHMALFLPGLDHDKSTGTFSKDHQGCHYSCIHIHCSPFTSITHDYPSLLHRHFSLVQRFFHTIHPSYLWSSSQPHTSPIWSHHLLHQPVLLHSFHIFKPPQHIALVTSQLSCNTNSPSHLLIPNSVHVSYLTHSSQLLP